RAVGGDVPMHEAVLVEPLLRVLPEAVEQPLVAHHHRDHHAVRDALADGGVGVTVGRVGPTQAPKAARALARDDLFFPTLVGARDVVGAGGGRVRTVREALVLRKWEAGHARTTVAH